MNTNKRKLEQSFIGAQGTQNVHYQPGGFLGLSGVQGIQNVVEVKEEQEKPNFNPNDRMIDVNPKSLDEEKLQEGKAELDKSQLDNQSKHIYFEPKFLSDFTIIYDNTLFHVHKFILVKESIYFRT